MRWRIRAFLRRTITYRWARRIVVAVMVDEPNNGVYYGGDVAAPVFSQVVQQTLRMLGVAPDLDVKQQIVTTAVQESF